MGLQRSENCHKGIERYIVKEGGISAGKAGLLSELSMKKSTLQVRLNRRVTFDHRIDRGPFPKLLFLIKSEGKKLFTDWLIELAKRGFGMSEDAFLKSVKKFLDKEVRIIPFNSRSSSPPYPSHLLCFIS